MERTTIDNLLKIQNTPSPNLNYDNAIRDRVIVNFIVNVSLEIIDDHSFPVTGRSLRFYACMADMNLLPSLTTPFSMFLLLLLLFGN